MDWDEFIEKFRNVEEKTDSKVIRAILDEFGSWENLAFGILEMKLGDKIKYSEISYSHTNEKKYARKSADARYLTDKLQEFKQNWEEINSG